MVTILFGRIFNKAWHFLVSKQAETNFVNTKNLNKTEDIILNNDSNDLDSKTDHSCNIAPKNDKKTCFPRTSF